MFNAMETGGRRFSTKSKEDESSNTFPMKRMETLKRTLPSTYDSCIISLAAWTAIRSWERPNRNLQLAEAERRDIFK